VLVRYFTLVTLTRNDIKSQEIGSLAFFVLNNSVKFLEK